MIILKCIVGERDYNVSVEPTRSTLKEVFHTVCCRMLNEGHLYSLDCSSWYTLVKIGDNSILVCKETIVRDYFELFSEVNPALYIFGVDVQDHIAILRELRTQLRSHLVKFEDCISKLEGSSQQQLHCASSDVFDFDKKITKAYDLNFCNNESVIHGSITGRYGYSFPIL